MNRYSIFHPLQGQINGECNLTEHTYELIGAVTGLSLDDAFYNSQNDFNEEYRTLNKRSTSVGDIIMVNSEPNALYMVQNVSFLSIPHAAVTFAEPIQPVIRTGAAYDNHCRI